MKHIAVQTEAFDPGALQATLEALGGAVASFTGICRADDGVTCMTLEHYPGMTERALEALLQEAEARWALTGSSIVHRVGPLVPGDRIVHVACASRHRKDALEACAFLIDRLKTDAPFWKKEERAQGASWVEAREGDHAAAEKWRG
jgi:molybdopterin synthase catalytic subunit